MIDMSQNWFDLAPTPMMVVELERFAIMAVNAAALDLYGYSRDELLQKTIMDLRDPEDIARTAQIAGKLLDGVISAGRSKHYTKSGTALHVEVKARVIDFEGRKAKLCSVHDLSPLRDIAQQNQSEQESAARLIAQAKATFRRAELLVSGDEDILIALDPESLTILWANVRFLSAISLGREMVTGSKLSALLVGAGGCEDEAARLEDFLRDSVRTGERKAQPGLLTGLGHLASETTEASAGWTQIALPLKDQDDKIVVQILVLRPWADATAPVADAELIFQISRQIRLDPYRSLPANQLARREIEQANLRLRVFRDLLGYADWQMDVETRRLIWSEEVFELLGIARPLESMTIDRYSAMVHKEDRKQVRESVETFLRSGEVFMRLRHRVMRPDGTTLFVEGGAERVRINGRDVLLGIVRDVTAEHQSRAAARRQQELARLAGRVAQVGGWYLDAQSQMIDWSEEVARMHKLPKTGVLTQSQALSFFKPKDRDLVAGRFSDCLLHGSNFDEFLEIELAPNQGVPVRLIGTPERDWSGQIVGISGAMQDLSEPVKQSNRMAELSDRLNSMIESMSDAFCSLDHDYRMEYVNRQAEADMNRTRAELLGENLFEILPELEGTAFQIECDRALQTGHPATFDMPIARTDMWYRIMLQPRHDRLDVIFRNITEDKRRQTQQMQTQKLEALGHLTGGIAHDFNNLLTVILGNTELLIEELTDPRLQNLASIAATAADRGAQLTSRLLSFARRQPLQPRIVLAEDIIDTLIPLLTRAVGENVKLDIRPDRDPWMIEVDPSQLENALLNLALNGREAMPDGGRLTIAISKRHPSPGSDADGWVVISMIDTGTGMDAATTARLFEPFFTTKSEGTGLGLPMVYGFVNQSGGSIEVDSTPGKGTTMRLVFPAARKPDVVVTETTRSAPLPRGGGEHVLVVEDDPHLRAFVGAQVRALGYRVSVAPNADTALKLLKRHPTIALLFTDVMLANSRNGRELAEIAQTLRPDLKVLYTSGYAAEVLASTGRLEPGLTLLAKPYARATMAAKLREVLDGG